MGFLSNRQTQQSHWRDVIALHAASGLTMIDFCRQHGLCSKTFYRWKARLSLASGDPSERSIPVVNTKPEFLRLQAPTRAAQSLLLVRLANGVRISVFDVATIPALLAVLR
jgi:transposase-like protein